MDNVTTLDALFQGKVGGSVAERLLANNMDTSCLRQSRTNKEGILVNANAALRYDEWKAFDEEVLKITTSRLVGANDLISRGLVKNLPNGLGTTILQYEMESDMTAAEVHMDAISRGVKDRPEYTIGYLPLPVVHKDFSINARALAASRKTGEPLDTAAASIAARLVAEKVETILFQGLSSYTFGGGVIYGYHDFDKTNTVAVTAHWNDSAASGATILADVLRMKAASISDKHYGPWGLYVPTTWEAALDGNYSSTYPQTVRDRLLAIGGIEFVHVADKQVADHATLVELQAGTARMVIGLQPQLVQWDSEGGMGLNFKLMCIMVPQLRADQDGNCGIVVATL